jgi:methionyl-tRNA synthetase
VLYDLAEVLRVVSILLKPFLPRSAETIYRTFNFKQPWEEVRFEDVWVHPGQPQDFRIVAELPGGKVKPLFPRIG